MRRKDIIVAFLSCLFALTGMVAAQDAKPAPKADPKPTPKADAKPAPKPEEKPTPPPEPLPDDNAKLEELLRSGFKKGPMLDTMLAAPMKGVDDIVFAIRIPGRDHWYVTFGNYSGRQPEPVDRAWKDEDGLIWGYGDGAMLVKMNIRTGEPKILLRDLKGGIRDPQLHYDGKKILFSYRPGGSHEYHLYEINVDGSGLKRLTDGEYDDIEPTYCPDGSIVFCSSRCKRFVNCWHTPVAALYRCDGDGKNVRLLSSNNDHDNTPWMLHDGRVLYMRWEYVDRSQVHYHHLWTMNPDGSQQMVYFGNQHAGIAMLDAKSIPGTDNIVSIFSPGHGSPEHFGYVNVVSPKKGPDDMGSARQLGKFRCKDPFAFSEECMIVANNDALFVMNGKGETEPFFTLPKRFKEHQLAVHEPRPIQSKPREAVAAPRGDLSKSTGYVILEDVYRGRSLEGLEKGKIKKLLVLKQLPKPINFSGGMEPLTIGGSFTMAEILGTVPVEEDGSAYAEIPALQSVFFVALDDNDMAVKRMHSFMTLQPGETMACVGCHEERTAAPHSSFGLLTALRRGPSRLQKIPETPAVFDFPRDIQPILDKHCVKCHDGGDDFVKNGKVDLSGDKTAMYTMAYWTMRTHDLVVDNRNRPMSNFPIYQIGSGASTLLTKYTTGGHYDVKITPHERDMLRLWIDTSATYPGTYASLRTGSHYAHLPLDGRCAECHQKEAKDNKGKPIKRWEFGRPTSTTRGTSYNISNPEKSFVLRAPLAKSAGGLELCGKAVFENKDDKLYQRLLTGIKDANRRLNEGKRFDMPGFRPNGDYIREMQKYGFVKTNLGATETFDFYRAEKEYFDSWYFAPELGDVKSAAFSGRKR